MKRKAKQRGHSARLFVQDTRCFLGDGFDAPAAGARRSDEPRDVFGLLRSVPRRHQHHVDGPVLGGIERCDGSDDARRVCASPLEQRRHIGEIPRREVCVHGGGHAGDDRVSAQGAMKGYVRKAAPHILIKQEFLAAPVVIELKSVK